MGIEIERKFLVNVDKWREIEKPKAEFYRQAYLLIDPKKTIRVRETETSAYITIKSLSIGISRTEFEYEIPKEDAAELIDKFSISIVTKKRFRIDFRNKIWEIDEFSGENSGLLLAEIELKDENEPFEIPNWIGQEVSGEEKYYNSNLSVNPYKNW